MREANGHTPTPFGICLRRRIDVLDDGWKTSGEFKMRESVVGRTEERVTARRGHLPEAVEHGAANHG